MSLVTRGFGSKFILTLGLGSSLALAVRRYLTLRSYIILVKDTEDVIMTKSREDVYVN